MTKTTPTTITTPSKDMEVGSEVMVGDSGELEDVCDVDGVPEGANVMGEVKKGANEVEEV